MSIEKWKSHRLSVLELGCGGVRDPVGVELVIESGVRDQAVERGRSLGYGAARLRRMGILSSHATHASTPDAITSQ